jgi:hypothetical protein
MRRDLTSLEEMVSSFNLSTTNSQIVVIADRQTGTFRE